MEHRFDDDNGRCMRPLPSPACAESVLRACLCASLISLVFVCYRPRRMEPAALNACLPSASLIFFTSLRTHSAHWTLRAPCVTDHRGLGLCGEGLWRACGSPAGVFHHDGVQREHRSLEHCENDGYEQRMRRLPSPVCGACVAWLGMRRGLSSVGRGRSSPRPCMLSSVLHLSLENYMCTSDNTESPTRLRPPHRRSCAASRPSSARALLRTHSLVPLDAACTVQWTDPSALGAHAARAL
jgi:hypothetical protein